MIAWLLERVSIDSGKAVTHCVCAFHSFRTGRSRTHRTTEDKLQYAELRIRVLEEQLRLMRIEKYGAGGEKLSQAQLELFELEPVVSEMIEQLESGYAPVQRSTKKSGKHPGRQELPANLPRVEQILPCAPDQRLCHHSLSITLLCHEFYPFSEEHQNVNAHLASLSVCFGHLAAEALIGEPVHLF